MATEIRSLSVTEIAHLIKLFQNRFGPHVLPSEVQDLTEGPPFVSPEKLAERIEGFNPPGPKHF